MTALLLLAVALCPKDAPPFKKAGASDRHFELVADKSSKLTQNGKVLFTYSGRPEQALFAAGDRYLALKEGDTVTLVTLDGLQSKQVKPLSLLTEEELRLVPSGECGPQWFVGWEETHYFLRIKIAQSALRRATEPAPPAVEVKLTWGGELKRITAEPDLDPKNYQLAWSGSIEPESRALVLQRAARYAPGLAKPPHTADFIKLLADATARPDVSEAELRAAARCLGALPAVEAMRLANVILARKTGADEEVLEALAGQATPESRALAARVFHERDRSARTRAEAVRVATNDGAIANDALWVEALSDAAGEVREAAAHGAGRHPPCSAAVFGALVAQRLGEAATRCLVSAAGPELAGQLAEEEHKAGPKLWASGYLELAFFANHQGQPKEALRLIDEGLGVRERSDVFNAARLLALKLAIARGTGDAALAADTLGDLKELKDKEVQVCAAEGEALKQWWSSAGCEPSKKVSELLEPAAKKKR